MLKWVVSFLLLMVSPAVSKPRPRLPTLPEPALKQKFALYAWDGSSTAGVATPQLLIADLQGYAVRPEGVDLINANGEWRILFVEDRFVTPGYGTRNAVHWPLNILGPVL